MTDGPPPPDRVRLVVLFGGRSAEHDISRVSAAHVLAAVDRSRYEVTVVGIDRDGGWHPGADPTPALESPAGNVVPLEITGPTEHPEAVLTDTTTNVPTVVFPVLHGPNGEDGTVQGLLELVDVPYVGCGVLGSAVSMDKAMAKTVLDAVGLPQCAWRAVHRSEATDLAATAARLIDELGVPLFVKPANMGSSVGVGRATDHAATVAALETAFSYDELVVVEEAVIGRELECGVLGDLDPRASVVGEIVPGAEFYDYVDKYASDAAKLMIPAELPEEVAEELRTLALRCFRALRGSGLARVDFFWEETGRGLLINEMNTMPGFTPISMYPRMWDATGVSYPELIDELVRLAIARHARRPRRTDHA